MQKLGTEMQSRFISNTKMLPDIMNHIPADRNCGVVTILQLAGIAVIIVRNKGFTGIKINNEALMYPHKLILCWLELLLPLYKRIAAVIDFFTAMNLCALVDCFYITDAVSYHHFHVIPCRQRTGPRHFLW